MSGTVVDVILVVVLASYAISGYRQGLIVGVASLVGFLGGGAIGAAFLPGFVSSWPSGPMRLLVVLGGVLVLASLGQGLAVLVGGRLRGVVTWRPARALDALLGLVASLVAVSLVVFFVGGALRGSPFPTLSRAIANSRVLAAIDSLVPPQAQNLFAALRGAVDGSGFPRVFAGLGPEPLSPVQPPSAGAASTPGVQRAAASIVKISGDAPSCSRGQEGSGFVVAPHRVVTNAHVVAGVVRPRVQVGGQGPAMAARVVLFDPEKDLAVLDVPSLAAPALPIGHDLARDAQAAIAGFPLDGPYQVGPARVRETLQASGEDIYGQPGVVRSVYSLYAKVEPGNSGGPLLNTDGTLSGVVFAKSLDNPQTGYALTLAEAAPVLRAAATASSTVSTGGCTPG